MAAFFKCLNGRDRASMELEKSTKFDEDFSDLSWWFFGSPRIPKSDKFGQYFFWTFTMFWKALFLRNPYWQNSQRANNHLDRHEKRPRFFAKNDRSRVYSL